MKSPSLCLLLLACFGSALRAEEVAIASGDVVWTVDSRTLQFGVARQGKAAMMVSSPCDAREARVEKVGSDRWSVSVDEIGLTMTFVPIASNGLEVRLESSRDGRIEWPLVSLDATNDELIWPLGEGVIFHVSDAFWRGEVMKEEWSAAESMSIPVWGVRRDGQMLSWMTTSPFRNTLSFRNNEGVDSLVVAQDFSAKAPSRSVAYRFYIDQAASDIAPAQHYRDFLQESGQFRTLAEKAVARPGVALLAGAPHVYLWGDGAVTRYDIPREKWKPFAGQLLKESTADPASFAAHLKTFFGAEQWSAVEECAAAEWPYDYVKDQITLGLSTALESDKLRDSKSWNLEQLAGDAKRLAVRKDSLSTSESLFLNSSILSASITGVFVDPRRWGNGVSLKMLDEMAIAGIERAKVCTEGSEALSKRPWLAGAAKERGWLIGPYDSYHSVHDPATKGSENTWETAQMAPGIYEHAAIVDVAGSFLTGFKGIGRKANPVAVRPFMEDRVGRNMEATAANYYFVDCDATGEVYDDYSAGHPLSREADAAERCRRLEWIGTEFAAVVGSEGGNAYAARSIDVAEGVFGPFFGWDDADMKDKASPYYRGRYYPPDGPEVNFKPVPIKERFRRLHYDPAHQVPLHAAAFHDSVVTTAHWSNAHFKYPEVRATVALREVLYLCPPMYHFNLSEFAKRKKQVLEHLAVWSPLHKSGGFERLMSFKCLDNKRLVQETRFENGICVVANFGDSEYSAGSMRIPAMSCWIDAPGVWPSPRPYTPTRETVP